VPLCDPMVLVSKLRGQSPAQLSTNSSFLGKIRSTLTRSSSSTTVKVVSDCNARRHSFESYSSVERFDESTSCGSSSERRSELPDPCDWPIDNILVLDDLEPEQHSVPDVQSHVDKAEPRSLTSICGGVGDQGAAADSSEPDLDAEPLSSRGSAAVAARVQNAIAGEEPTVRSAVDSKPVELKGRLWDPADPPRQTHPAWQIKRDTEVKETHVTKTRFPARLPPLSGLTTKGLRKTGSTPVLQVHNLPEPGR
jgi:hypothetical protein